MIVSILCPFGASDITINKISNNQIANDRLYKKVCLKILSLIVSPGSYFKIIFTKELSMVIFSSLNSKIMSPSRNPALSAGESGITASSPELAFTTKIP